ncbi:hypothetical protein LCGC14_1745120 [marine sediment metagenome]|uniref:Uncharacterized protein n=1 Tax=marine sediment metagenome TaxID=412755 RepID=A0A0F9JKU4_9ZZZZ
MSEDQNIIQELQAEHAKDKTKNAELATALASSNYDSNERRNLIEYQLDSAELLSKVEHFLRGDFIDTDDKGNEYWAKQKDKDLIMLNNYGVNAVLLIMGNYVDKGTALSTYDDLRINEILADLGDELVKFIFCNYEKMGMDTQNKRTRYGLIVINILHMIESTYRRALRGKTSEDINTSKIFTQSDSMGMGGATRPGSERKRSMRLFDPRTW